MRKGVIPASVADTIVNLAFGDLDIDRIAQISHEKQHSLLGLIQEMQRIAGPEAGEYVHFGATTQDFVDTGLVLQVAVPLVFFPVLADEFLLTCHPRLLEIRPLFQNSQDSIRKYHRLDNTHANSIFHNYRL